ncbi:MAG: MBOAT family protein [Bacteroidia bacterium]|nr:MBOAT family protein [Bacteroidia bacterium]
MLFNSFAFIVFFLIVTILYFTLPHRFRWLLLLVASYYFYMSWKPVYATLLVCSTVVTFYSGLLIGKSQTHRQRKFYLWTGILINLGFLFFFKYFNFFNDSVRLVFEHFDIAYPVRNLDILLPVGISFYTFQTLSYSLDVYYKQREPEKHAGIFALYVSFFPQLVAGPIERSTRLLPQFYNQNSFDYERTITGIKYMLWGLFKKIVIADRISVIVDKIYMQPEIYDGYSVLLASLLFAFQLYCDFSAYSDIATGAAKILGYDLMKNFNHPYLSRNVTEFWRRWHISLSTWLRDYLYYPLMLSCKNWGKAAMVFSIFVTFIFCGLWHGPRWTYIIFGVLQGIALIYELFTQNARKRLAKLLPSWLYIKSSIIITFCFTLFCFIFFRAENLNDSFVVIEKIFIYKYDFNSFIKLVDNIGIGWLGITLILLILFMLTDIKITKFIEQQISPVYPFLEKLLYPVLLAIIIIFGAFGEIEFIYFQF